MIRISVSAFDKKLNFSVSYSSLKNLLSLEPLAQQSKETKKNRNRTIQRFSNSLYNIEKTFKQEPKIRSNPQKHID